LLDSLRMSKRSRKLSNSMMNMSLSSGQLSKEFNRKKRSSSQKSLSSKSPRTSLAWSLGSKELTSGLFKISTESKFSLKMARSMLLFISQAKISLFFSRLGKRWSSSNVSMRSKTRRCSTSLGPSIRTWPPSKKRQA
jgi:hypothetical protein